MLHRVAGGADFLVDLKTALQRRPVIGAEHAVERPLLVRRLGRFLQRARDPGNAERQADGDQAEREACASQRLSAEPAVPGAGGFEHRGADADRQRPRPLDLAEQRHQDQEVEIVVEGRELPERHDPAFRRLAADIAERDDVDQQQPRDEAVDRPEARRCAPARCRARAPGTTG